MDSDKSTESCPHIGKPFPIPRIGYFVDGSQYQGFWDAIGIAGLGRFVTPHNARLEGQFCDGTFHGYGQLQWPRGQKIQGFWVRGKRSKSRSRYTFRDGLAFNQVRWNYCSYPDRRFYEEIVNGLRPVGETNNIHPCLTRLIPPLCYDAGIGIFDSYTGTIVSYEDPAKVLEIPTKTRVKWIKENCRKGISEPTGHCWWLDDDYLHRSNTQMSELAYNVLVQTLDSPESSWQRLTTFTRDPNVALISQKANQSSGITLNNCSIQRYNGNIDERKRMLSNNSMESVGTICDGGGDDVDVDDDDDDDDDDNDKGIDRHKDNDIKYCK